MASLELPSEYDAIVLGSGMTECIIAAALSRIGYNVLHLDRNDYYSGDWACFNWKGLQEWITTHQSPETNGIIPKEVDLKQLLKDGESVVELQVNSSAVSSVEQASFISDKPSKEESLPMQTANLDISASAEAPLSSNTDNEERNTENSASVPGGASPEERDTIVNERDQTVMHEQVQSTSDDATDQQSTGEHTVMHEQVPSTSNGTANSMQDDNSNTDSNAGQSGGPTSGETSQETGVEDKMNCDTSESKEAKQYYMEDISSQWRKFNIDLMPKVLYCKGAMVELLISSDVAKYCEFKTISRVLTYIKDRLEPVPCSRADVFSSKQVSMIEKRMMMKFLQFCINYSSQPQEYEGSEEMPFCDFLKTKKLSENVCHYIQHSIAMVNDTVTTLEGLESCQRFLQSLGRYGNTAFLWPVYGSGELPQCFCRMCAVFGGCYCLRRTGTHLVLDGENKCTGIIDTEGQKLNCKWLVLESSYAPLAYRQNTVIPKISRAIFITTHSILHRPDQEDITQMSFPRGGELTPITLYEVGPSAYTCPKGIVVVHLTCDCSEGAKTDLEDIVSKLFAPIDCEAQHQGNADDRPRILWQLYFEVENTTGLAYPDCPDGVHLVPGPDSKMDFENSIERAREIFASLCPGEEFLPKAPNPEDIIWNEGDPNKETKDSGFGTESAAEKETQNETKARVEEESSGGKSVDPTHLESDSSEGKKLKSGDIPEVREQASAATAEVETQHDIDACAETDSSSEKVVVSDSDTTDIKPRESDVTAK